MTRVIKFWNFLILVWFCTTFVTASARAQDIGFVLGLDRTSSKTSGFANSLETEAFVSAFGQYRNLSFSASATLNKTSGQRQRSEFEIKELYYTFNPPSQSNYTITLGKQILSWDVSSIFQPLAFLQDKKLSFSAFDNDRNTVGIWALNTTIFHQAGATNLTFVRGSHQNDDGFNRGADQIFLRTSGSAGAWDYSIFARRIFSGQNDTLGFGSSLGYGVLETLIAYGSFYSENQLRRPDKNLALRISGDRRKEWYSQAMVGVNWAPLALGGGSMTTEFLYDQTGLTKSEMATIPFVAVPSPTRGQHYAAIGLTIPLENFRGNGTLVQNLDDNSKVLATTFSYDLENDWQLNLKYSQLIGGVATEFGAVGEQRNIAFGIRRFF